MKRNLVNWAKAVSKVKKDESKKLEGQEKCNRFKDLDLKVPNQNQFNATTGFKKR